MDLGGSAFLFQQSIHPYTAMLDWKKSYPDLYF